jgi:hypothetical protein
LLQQAGHPLTEQEVGEINGLFKGNFDGNVQLAIDGTLALAARALDRLQCDVAFAYGLRNYGAHNTGTAATIYNRFAEAEATLFRAFFATIDHL